MSNTLTDTKHLLVRRWGEMGGYWGISRTMAEIHALLFVSSQPLCTDDVMAQLHVSRGNASMNLRGLIDWGLIRREHRFGDRKEYFVADTDVWHMFETILRERRRREVEPILTTIERCREMVAAADLPAAQRAEAADIRSRLDALREFLTTMGTLFDTLLHFGHAGITEVARVLAVDPGPDGQSTHTSAGGMGKPRAATRAPSAAPRKPGSPPRRKART